MKSTSALAFEIIDKLEKRAILLRRQIENIEHRTNDFYKEYQNYSGQIASKLIKTNKTQWNLVSLYGSKKVQIFVPIELIDEESDVEAAKNAKNYFSKHFAKESVSNDAWKIESIIEQIRHLPRNVAQELIDGLSEKKNLESNNTNHFGYVYSHQDQKDLANSLKLTLDKIYGVS